MPEFAQQRRKRPCIRDIIGQFSLALLLHGAQIDARTEGFARCPQDHHTRGIPLAVIGQPISETGNQLRIKRIAGLWPIQYQLRDSWQWLGLNQDIHR
jgi:hypothetical protein